MKATAALMWKEWRQVRWFFFVGVLIFLGAPMAEALNHYGHHQELRTSMPEGIVPAFGGVLAIFVAVGLTCQDLKQGVAYFWQSRPVRVWQWALNKYVMGLVMVLAICCGSLLMQWYMTDGGSLARPGEFLTGVLYVHTWTIVLIYSLAFLFGSLMRKAVYATIFSIAAGLLVYFLPVLVPPLGAFSVMNIMEQWPLQLVKLSELGQGGPWFGGKLRIVKLPWAEDLGLRYNIELLRYALVAVGAGAMSCVLAGIAVKRNWRIKVGQKLMYWSLGAVMLLLLCTFAFQVGSNLECVRQIPLRAAGSEERRTVGMAAIEGDKGVLFLHNGHWRSAGDNAEWFVQRFDLAAECVLVGDEIPLGKEDHPSIAWAGDEGKMVWSAERPEYLYFIEQANFEGPNDKRWKLGKLELVTVRLGDGGKTGIIGKLDLLKHIGDVSSSVPRMYLEGETLYIALNREVVMVNMSVPAAPVVSEVVEGRPGYWGEGGGGGGGWRWIKLVAGDDKSLEERLAVTLKLESFMHMASEGDVTVYADRDHFVTYQLKGIDRFGASVCRLETTGWRSPTPVERLMDAYPRQVFLRDGFAYVLYHETDFGGLMVYDVRRPESIKKVGHYAAPDEQFAAIAPLPDGNILLCGRSLHVVAPPKAARGK